MDTEGPVEIDSRWQDKRRGKDRQVDWIVREMKQYNVKVEDLQEITWFGTMMCMMYITGAAMLTSGRKISSVGENAQRGGVVVIVLMGWTVDSMKSQAWVSLLAGGEEEISCGFMLCTNKSSQQRRIFLVI